MTFILPLLLVLVQVGGWVTVPPTVSVGDTVRVVRQMPAAAGVTVRLDPLAASELLEPLAPPRWSYAEGTVDVTYTVAAFRPGRHAVAMPAIDLVYPNDRIETVPGGTATIEVVSVLPSDGPAPAPKPSLAPIPRARRSLLLPIVLPLAVAVVTAAAVVSRRRRRPRPAPPGVLGEHVHPPMDTWIAAGESRAVATVVALELRRAIAADLPDVSEHLDAAERADAILEESGDPAARELVAVLRSLERARFSPAAPADVHEVVDEAERAMQAFRASRRGPA